MNLARTLRPAQHSPRLAACITFVLLLALLPTPAPATDLPTLVLEDETGDGQGPGSYRLPHGRDFRAGCFDLTRVAFHVDGDTVEIRARVRTRVAVARHARVATDAYGDYALLQLDIYVDRDGRPGAGLTRTVPGRRVLIDASGAWDHGVIITALPGRVRSALSRVAPELSERLYVTSPTRVSGGELVARVPASALGGPPQPDWGYTVLASSLTLSTSVRGIFLGEGDGATVYTREVTATPGTCENWEEDLVGRPCTFGGCAPCGGHPRVLDAIVAGSSSQQLRRYRQDRWALLFPLVPSGARPAPALPVLAPPTPEKPAEPLAPMRCKGGGRFHVQDRDGDVVTIVGKDRSEVEEIGVGRIGALLDDQGRKLGRALLTSRKGTVCLLERLAPADPADPVPTFVELDCR